MLDVKCFISVASSLKKFVNGLFKLRCNLYVHTRPRLITKKISFMAALSNQIKNQHLLWRAGFGPSASQLLQLDKISPKALYYKIEIAAKVKPEQFDVASNFIRDIYVDRVMDYMDGNGVKAKTALDTETKRKIRQQSREDIKALNLKWMNTMVGSEAQLREKLALFWHGHFACKDVNIYNDQLLLNVIRDNAAGSFGDLLKGVSKSASMLSFLNNQQNKKQKPNENFAREVMELFTLGRGNYTENDIKEAARAFTGWAYNLKGEFIFRKNQHDTGTKTVLGKTGNLTGDDVLNILLEQKQTALFITQKIYRFFVNEKLDDGNVKYLADRFYQSNYNIQGLMKDIFTSNWFYDEKNISAIIKSPLDLIIGIQRMLPMQIETQELLLLFQRALGQVLFYPPNVAGWPGGKTWIDSSTLMLRLRIPQLLEDDDEFELKVKADDDVQMGMKEVVKAKGQAKTLGEIAKTGFKMKANIDWDKFIIKFKEIPRTNLFTALQQTVLQTRAGSVKETSIKLLQDETTRENYIKTVTIALMSTPEYQLC